MHRIEVVDYVVVHKNYLSSGIILDCVVAVTCDREGFSVMIVWGVGCS